MNNLDERQQRHAATMKLLESMAAFVDELLEEREEKQRLEDDWQERSCKQTSQEENQ